MCLLLPVGFIGLGLAWSIFFTHQDLLDISLSNSSHAFLHSTFRPFLPCFRFARLLRIPPSFLKAAADSLAAASCRDFAAQSLLDVEALLVGCVAHGCVADVACAPAKGSTCLSKQPHVCVCAVSYTHLRAHETKANLVCRLLLEKKKNT